MLTLVRLLKTYFKSVTLQNIADIQSTTGHCTIGHCRNFGCSQYHTDWYVGKSQNFSGVTYEALQDRSDPYAVHVLRLAHESTIYESIVDLRPVKRSQAFQPSKMNSSICSEGHW